MQILDQEGKVVEECGVKKRSSCSLRTGTREYILHEEQAPTEQGYVRQKM